MKQVVMLLMIWLAGVVSAKEQWVAYNVLVDAKSENYEIFVMDRDGNNQRNISNHPAIEWVYFAYGDRLYFLSDRDQCYRCFYLYEMDGNGEQLRQVTDFYLADSWFGSRDGGKELIVKPKADESADFYIIDLEGEIKQRIKLDFAYVNDPAFSPDGQSIVFRAADKSSPRELGFADELYVTSLAEIKPQQLTQYPTYNPKQKWQGYLAATPRWRTDGKISYATYRDGNYDIFLINADGSKRQQITKKSGSQVYHDWLPDGTLVYESAAKKHSGYDIFLQKPDGEVVQLTDDAIEQFAPVFVDAPKDKEDCVKKR